MVREENSRVDPRQFQSLRNGETLRSVEKDHLPLEDQVFFLIAKSLHTRSVVVVVLTVPTLGIVFAPFQ